MVIYSCLLGVLWDIISGDEIEQIFKLVKSFFELYMKSKKHVNMEKWPKYRCAQNQYEKKW